MNDQDQTHNQVHNPLLVVVDGQAKARSREVAKHFGKSHAHVLRDINELEIPDDFRQSNFGLAEYKDAQGKPRPMFEMTRDGFTLLTMGFTGKRAMAWKLAYIAEWNRMEAMLNSIHENMDGLIANALKNALPGLLKQIQETTIQTTAKIVMDHIQKRLLELEIRLDRRTAAVDHMSAKQVLDREKVPSKKRRGLVIKVSSRLRSFCSELDVVALRSAETGTWLFPIHVIKQWMKVEGSTLISGHLAALYGQLEMVFDDKHMDEQNKTSVGTPVQTTH